MITNATELGNQGDTGSRSLALRVAGAGLEACDVAGAAERAVSAQGNVIEIDHRAYRLGPAARVIVVGAGKATLEIAAVLEAALGSRLSGGAVVIREGEDTGRLERVQVIVADHPLPSERSVAAALRLLELADDAREGDLVLACFTGGSSALASVPPAGVSADEKRRLHELLLGSGASIAEVNTVRKHVSGLKGGRLAARAAPATVVNLTVSDVAGDVLDVLTDPSVQDTSNADAAVEVVRRRGLWDAIPAAVGRHLTSAAAESPRLARQPETVLLVTGALVCEAMAREAREAGVASQIVSTELEGEAADLGRSLAELAIGAANGAGPVAAPCVLVGCGGEAAVSLGSTGAFGGGGPNQEAAIAAALRLAEAVQVAMCFLDTDGSDGGTAAAGAIVDGQTAARAAQAGVDLRAALAEHRSGAALEQLDDQILTGPTGTNVNDLFVLAALPGRRETPG
jgi:glycerate 2-kinase